MVVYESAACVVVLVGLFDACVYPCFVLGVCCLLVFVWVLCGVCFAGLWARHWMGKSHCMIVGCLSVVCFVVVLLFCCFV